MACMWNEERLQMIQQLETHRRMLQELDDPRTREMIQIIEALEDVEEYEDVVEILRMEIGLDLQSVYAS